MTIKTLGQKIGRLERRLRSLERYGSPTQNLVSAKRVDKQGWEKLHGLRKNAPISKKTVEQVRKRLFGV
ncbi:hypothetical protein HY626_01995 [Candidatus Uhrbacteria bacterium]|nr:hypothetical protein [Candidatus Uhrbacteria bacterium]